MARVRDKGSGRQSHRPDGKLAQARAAQLRAEYQLGEDQQNLNRAQAIQAENGNQRRTPAPVFRPGDQVWLDARNITTRRRLGPYEVVEAVGPNAVRLRLPETMHIHPVFHVSLLEHAADDPLPGQQSLPPPAIIVDGEEKWEVEWALDSRLHYNRLQYLVKWKGYDAPTWQPTNDMEHAAEAVREFHHLNTDRPRPPSLAGARTINLAGSGRTTGPGRAAKKHGQWPDLRGSG